MLKLCLVSLSVLCLVPGFINLDINEELPYDKKEAYDPSLSGLNSIGKLVAFTDSIAVHQNASLTGVDYYIILDSVISRRFYHGFSSYTLKENWIAAIGQKIFGYGMAVRIQPDDMMDSPSAGCSQQAAIMMYVAKIKQNDFRKVGFPHHYALEVRDHHKWYYFDPNMEPVITKAQRLHANWNEQNDSLKKFYSTNIHPNLDYQLGTSTRTAFGTVNEDPAPHLKTFQSITIALSRILWACPLLFLFVQALAREPGLKGMKPALLPSNDLFRVLPA